MITDQPDLARHCDLQINSTYFFWIVLFQCWYKIPCVAFDYVNQVEQDHTLRRKQADTESYLLTT